MVAGIFAAGTIVATALLIPGTASAAVTAGVGDINNCPINYFRIFSEADFGGNQFEIANGVEVGDLGDVGFGNSELSLVNLTDKTYCVHTRKDFNGDVLEIPAVQYSSQVHTRPGQAGFFGVAWEVSYHRRGSRIGSRADGRGTSIIRYSSPPEVA